MKERCIFTAADFQEPAFPKNKGDCGECYANPGKEMNGCCFEAAKRLIMLDQKEEVIDVAGTLRGKALSQTSRLRGLSGALINLP
ncbi:MAG: hypothetical protein UV71_C0012G0029 [Microgenomates group bacterium GW2011_GWC1_43_13]|uniref:Uncharacterized protein n=3 Tax=Candidatus Woeseibacteriota TaxID=1752722 RepID=A0A837IKL6_9BACT|nr:MAG: hypothetical protein UV71_C0012G0029 [Microgenomates group bacterium GW2011_GWC1_43_13]KKT33108.1 MAG: hypothetical protein UW20_C0005G0040 [Candidatus Woesebacteria bacterium GW2011_GWB1_44_11]KKT54770.1 MAG: hypothetical protein UW47_C0003G0039 [Candidatus Woesebacteria bacterium GW2011_GWA1_44_23]OGM76322.1 MAG: hypothetical protein A2208_01075 [Candidatus Woesebacteria bacterium RIFOXYA1_FULL_43_16]OGM81545.1 MAG: hypothetical protein A2394_01115 [Candidatus Woesebacteria bacterium 